MFHIKRCFGKLNKKQSDEIGTLKSPTKPLYIAKQNVQRLNEEKEELETLLPMKYQMEEDIKKSEKELSEEEDALKVLQEMENLQNISKLEEEKIAIHIKAKGELERTKEELSKEEKDIKPVRKEKVSSMLYIIPIILLGVAAFLFLRFGEIYGLVAIIASLIGSVAILSKKLKVNKNYKYGFEEEQSKRRDLQARIELIEKDIKSKENIINENTKVLNNRINEEKEKIKKKYPGKEHILLYGVEDRSSILEEQNYINDLKLSLSEKKLRKDEIIRRLEKLVEIEEKLNANKEMLEELIKYEEEINIAKDALESAYLEMKESITPRFTENLSNAIRSITSEKYKTVKVNEENGLLLETANRKLCFSKYA